MDTTKYPLATLSWEDANDVSRIIFPWTTCFINYYEENQGCTPHFDIHDLDNSSYIFVLGEFTGGEVVIVSNREIYSLQKGQGLLVNSTKCVHGVLPVLSGKKISLIFFIHKQFINFLVNKLQV